MNNDKRTEGQQAWFDACYILSNIGTYDDMLEDEKGREAIKVLWESENPFTNPVFKNPIGHVVSEPHRWYCDYYQVLYQLQYLAMNKLKTNAMIQNGEFKYPLFDTKVSVANFQTTIQLVMSAVSKWLEFEYIMTHGDCV